MDINKIIAEELNVKTEYVANVISLMDEGCTIPFIARYRKEAHAGMDDTSLRKLSERVVYLRNLEERKETIIGSIEEQGKMTKELRTAIENAMTQTVLEDIYRPYKPKKKTRASVAKAKGLEPLADFIMLQGPGLPEAEAERFVNPENGVEDVTQALQGAMDIIAESVSDDAGNRAFLRDFLNKDASVCTAFAKDEDSVYRQYYEFSQPVRKMKGHQILAVNRGEKEGFLKVNVTADHDKAKGLLKKKMKISDSLSKYFIEKACEDAYGRLIWPALEREIRSSLTDMACEGAIGNFALNLKPLLMQPPVKGRVTMGLDPGYAHGCKVAVVDGTGKVLDTAVVYPTFSEAKKEESIIRLSAMIKKHKVEHIAIGNGTASRETESMACEMIGRLKGGQSYAIVNEAGASVYSASELGAEEFPQYDTNIRSAISIARRLQDPLAELVKIDPMAIGVGQYQHDMPQAQLKNALEGVVEDCVNSVGVDVNSASSALLCMVSGLTKTTAKNIVLYREANGAFKSRREILKVPKMGPKSYEQCAGFLRVPESSEILDNTAVHPESYEAAGKILKACGYTEADVRAGKIGGIKAAIDSIGRKKLAEACGIGIPTLNDIVSELLKPGRDPRSELPPVVLKKDILKLEDLAPGMKLKGTVRNVIDFGAFVDIGVHQDGLVHISKICSHYIKHPSEVLKVGDIVDVTILQVDPDKKRISLSMIENK